MTSLRRRLRRAVLAPVAAWLARALAYAPPRALAELGRALGTLGWLVARRARQLTCANLARAFPGETGAAHRVRGQRAFAHLGEVAADLIAALRGRRALPDVQLDDLARGVLETALAQGRGVVLVSAHLGPWERVAQAIDRAGLPLTALVRTPPQPELAALLARIRGTLPVVDRDRPGALRAMVRALRHNGIVGIPMDLATRSASLDAPLFESPARTAAGPARLALHTGAAIVAATAVRDEESGRIRVTCTHIDTHHATDAREITTRINEELGARIRAYSEGWLWMHDRFAPGRTADA